LASSSFPAARKANTKAAKVTSFGAMPSDLNSPKRWSASCHCAPFSNALTAALNVITSTSINELLALENKPRACRQQPAFSHAAMAVLSVTMSGSIHRSYISQSKATACAQAAPAAHASVATP